MSDLFVTEKNNYNIKNSQALESSHKRTVKLGQKLFPTEGLKYRS